jgi:hypothetical protein
MTTHLKYLNNEDRKIAFKRQQNNYSKKRYKCKICHCFLNLGNKTKHKRTQKHQFNLNNVNTDIV